MSLWSPGTPTAGPDRMLRVHVAALDPAGRAQKEGGARGAGAARGGRVDGPRKKIATTAPTPPDFVEWSVGDLNPRPFACKANALEWHRAERQKSAPSDVLPLHIGSQFIFWLIKKGSNALVRVGSADNTSPQG